MTSDNPTPEEADWQRAADYAPQVVTDNTQAARRSPNTTPSITKTGDLNPKSDVSAKGAFIAHLLAERRFDQAWVTRRPADITARKGSATYYFEIKYTSQLATYFGAATLTEWEAAFENDDFYRFVIASRSGDDSTFTEFTPLEFMEFSYIPPFKVFFNIPIGAGKASPSSAPKSRKVKMSRQKLSEMLTLYKRFRSEVI
jgi:hypothetical protein